MAPSSPIDGLNRLDHFIHRHQGRVDFLTIRLESAHSTDIAFKNNQLETLGETMAIGGHVRACHNGGWGFASFSGLDDLDRHIEAAIAAARWVGTERTQLAPIPIHQRTLPLHLPGTAPTAVDLSRKKRLCGDYSEILTATGAAISSTGVRYEDCTQQVWIATSEGTRIEQSWADMEMRFFAVARQGELVQTGRETCGSRYGFEELEHLHTAVANAGQRAIASLSYPTVPGGTYTVIIDPILTGLFVHEAFGHLSEADTLYENPDLLDVMTLGRQFGPESLNIWDGAVPPHHRGSYAYDDEGTPAAKTQLIQEGRLVGRLHSRETAGALGEIPTGNCRCLDFLHSPIVRMTNTWIGAGESPVQELIRGVDQGLYAANWLGGSTNGELFTFTAGEGRLIRKGQLAEPVRDITLSGNVFQTLKAIDGIGNDFTWDESGGCGKGGQAGLAVGVGGPSLRISNVTIGGQNKA